MKVTVIGGGSYQWVPNLVADLLRTPSLEGLELALVDLNPDPLPDMAQWVKAATGHYGRHATVTTTTDRREALEGSDAVVVTISTGGFDSMRHDLAIPERYGYRQSVGDSVGPGGINRAVRNIPVMVGIARDMEQLCPDAWLLNITNPMTVLTRSVSAATSIRAVGLCHEIAHSSWELALLAGKGFDDVRLTLMGVNHFPVVTAVQVGDRDGLAMLREVLDGTFEDTSWANEHTSAAGYRTRNQAKLAMFEQWGVLPAAGDRHLVEFLPGYLTEASHWAADYGVHLTTIADRERDQAKYVNRVTDLLTGAEEPPNHDSGEIVAPFLDSLATGTARRAPLNIQNVGQAPQLPAGAVVESMCGLGKDGWQIEEPVTAPEPVAELLRRHCAVQELVVQATIEADLSLLHSAYLLDPLAGRADARTVTRMCDELLAATREWLSPEWQKVVTA